MLTLLHVEQSGRAGRSNAIVTTVVVTVLASAVLPGLTAAPGIAWDARALARRPDDAAERRGPGTVPSN